MKVRPPLVGAVWVCLQACQPAEQRSGDPSGARLKPAVPVPSSLRDPESILWDPSADRYLVSNMNGHPTERDNNGSISSLAPNGADADWTWIEGSRAAPLHAPKGMAILGADLLVADIDHIRVYDLRSGEPRKSVLVPEARMLNDLLVVPEGIVVSDMLAGVVTLLEPKRLVPVAQHAVPGANGLAQVGDRIWVGRFDGAGVMALDLAAGTGHGVAVDLGRVDGIASTPEGVFVASWSAPALLRVDETQGQASAVLAGTYADLGYDPSRSLLLLAAPKEDAVFFFDPRTQTAERFPEEGSPGARAEQPGGR